MFKMSCKFHDDVDVVWDNLNYVKGNIDLLKEEYHSQIKKESSGVPVFIRLLNVQKLLSQAVSEMEQLRWEEEKRVSGPLARPDMPF